MFGFSTLRYPDLHHCLPLEKMARLVAFLAVADADQPEDLSVI